MIESLNKLSPVLKQVQEEMPLNDGCDIGETIAKTQDGSEAGSDEPNAHKWTLGKIVSGKLDQRSDRAGSSLDAGTDGTGGIGGDSQTRARTEAEIQAELNSLYPGDEQTSLANNSAGLSNDQGSVTSPSTQK